MRAIKRTGWHVVVPVKCTALGKSRLAGFAGPARPELAFAFALDTVTAALAAAAVEQVLVVTNDQRLVERAAHLGAQVRPDPERGLNAAYRAGADAAPATAPIAGLQGDLPALRSSELSTALDLCAAFDSAFVADADDAGTTLYAARRRELFRPAFGIASRAAHARGGACEVNAGAVPGGLVGLRRDVDTGGDLLVAQGLGIGAHSSSALARLHPDPRR